MKRIKTKIEVSHDRTISVWLLLQRVEDDNPEDIISEKLHLICLAPGADLAVFRAANEAHLAQPFSVSGIPGAPWPKIPDDEWAEVEAIVGVLHTPARVAKRRSDDLKNEMTMNVTRK